MSDPQNPNGQADVIPDGGILAALPRARPQRASPHRAGTRSQAGKAQAVATVSKPEAKQTRPAKTRTAKTQTTKTKTAKGPTAKTVKPRRTKTQIAKAPASSVQAAKKTTVPRVRVGHAKTTPTHASPKVPLSSRPLATKSRLSPLAATEPPAPRQGYEPEEEVELGTTVDPPSGVELVESVADIVGELANSGLAAGGRLLKDAFSLLRRP